MQKNVLAHAVGCLCSLCLHRLDMVARLRREREIHITTIKYDVLADVFVDCPPTYNISCTLS